MKRTILLSVFCLSAMMAGARTFTDSYLKLRRGDPSLIKSLDRQDIRELIDSTISTWDSAGKSEKEIAKHERERKLFSQAERVDIVIDMDDDMSWLTTAKFDRLTRPDQELISMQMDGMNLSALTLSRRDKVKELIVLMGAPGEEEGAMLFCDVVFNKPVALQDYMEDGDVKSLIGMNASGGEGASPLIKFDFKQSKSRSEPNIPGYDNSVPYKLEVVQVDGKYGVRRIPEQSSSEYLIKPTFTQKPVVPIRATRMFWSEAGGIGNFMYCTTNSVSP